MLTAEKLKDTAAFIINNFKNLYIDPNGHISRSYPRYKDTIYSDLDDLTPFFLYFNEDEFILEQIKRSRETTYSGLIVFNEKIVSWRNDEYLGALCCYYRKNRDIQTKEYIEESYSNIRKYLFKGNNIIAYYDLRRRKSPDIYSTWSGGLLEVLLENKDLFPGWEKPALAVIDNWLEGYSFKQHGIFMAKNHIKSRFFNLLNSRYKTNFGFLNNSLWNTTGYYINRNESLRCFIFELLFDFLYSLPTGFYIQFMKQNTSFIFSLIEAYKQTKNLKYKSAVERWISSVREKMYKDGFLYTDWSPADNSCRHSRMVDCFIMIDILCDYYALVENNQKYLLFAKELADNWLSLQFDNGLFPRQLKEKTAHIDDQIDFSISLRRLGELTADESYLLKGWDCMENILNLYRVKDGFVTLMDSDSNKINAENIDIKYNGLLLKGIISHMEKEARIYNCNKLRDLLKDR